jgi:hypothetical protein
MIAIRSAMGEKRVWVGAAHRAIAKLPPSPWSHPRACFAWQTAGTLTKGSMMP